MRVRYYDNEWNEREGEELERNGSLHYVEDENGEGDWVPDFMVEDEL